MSFNFEEITNAASPLTADVVKTFRLRFYYWNCIFSLNWSKTYFARPYKLSSAECLKVVDAVNSSPVKIHLYDLITKQQNFNLHEVR